MYRHYRHEKLLASRSQQNSMFQENLELERRNSENVWGKGIPRTVPWTSKYMIITVVFYIQTLFYNRVYMYQAEPPGIWVRSRPDYM